MKLALDYDGTYTRDPDLWDTFIAAAQGHRIDIWIDDTPGTITPPGSLP